MQNDNAIKTLNNLIEVSEDGAKGYKLAAEDCKDAKLKVLFTDLALNCETAVIELRAAVQSLGGTAETGGSVAGTAHRGWVKIKAALADSNIAVLEEVERGEDKAKAVYQHALKAGLPASILTLIEKQAVETFRHHDRIRDLRNSYKAAAI